MPNMLAAPASRNSQKATRLNLILSLINLDRVKAFLNKGLKISSFKLGFFRSEGDGVYRISQTSVEDSHESRLYIHFYTKGRTIYLLGIGDKSDQGGDIKAAKKLAKKLP
jgi:putative component of toxin-antitoxin plasmid stabilization module